MSQSETPGGPTIQQVEAVILAQFITATFVTVFRLAERLRQRRVWFDDGWAAFAMILNIINCVVGWLYMHDYTEYSQTTNVVLYYMIAQLFCAIVWASRISILFTVLRLTIPFSTLRRILLGVFVIFLMTWMILFAQAFWICEAETGWKSQPRPQCYLGVNVAIAQIITDVLGDTILVIVPLHLVYRVRLNRAQKIRIISIFSASVITTVVCVTHSYYVLSGGGTREAVAAAVEESVSIIVANLSVIVAVVFRINTEETTTFSDEELKSVIVFASRPVWVKASLEPSQPTTTTGTEVTTIILDDFFISDSESSTRSERNDDTEACTLTGPVPANPPYV